ncbi:MAG: S16 family serine protease [Verrucomicrobiota bacterium]
MTALAVTPAVQGQVDYELDASAFPFKAEDLQMEAAGRKQLATMLADWAKSVPEGKEQRKLQARALVVALGLDPTNRSAVIAKARFRRKDSLGEPGQQVDPNSLAKRLIQSAKLMKDVGGEADQQAASYLAELAYEAAPGNEEIVYETELIRAEIPMPVAWKALVGDATASALSRPNTTASSKPVPEPTKPTTTGAAQAQAQINGLVVLSTEGGFIGGKVMEINATLVPADNRSTTLEFMTAVGEDMDISKKEAQRLALNRAPDKAKGHVVRLSFDDKYSEKAGGSAGTAFCVVALSLLQDFKIDEKVAMTGDINVDGKVVRVGGIADKIKGAARDGCDYVGIPKENLGELDNYLVLGFAGELAKTQVFSLETIDEAVDLARVDRSENLQSAMDKFAGLQGKMDGRYWGAVVRSPENRKLLEEVVELAPNHQSAQYLLKAASGQAPRHLTIIASLDGMFKTVSPILAVLAQNKHAKVKLDSSKVRALVSQLNQLRRKIHPKTRPVYHELQNVIQQLEAYQAALFQHFGTRAGSTSVFTDSEVGNLNRLERSVMTSWRRLIDSVDALDYDSELRNEILSR